jgi:hypothetical protein
VKFRIQDLQEKAVLANESRILHSQKHLQNFLSGKPVDENDYNFHGDSNSNVYGSKMDHCSDQETKRLRVEQHLFF